MAFHQWVIAEVYSNSTGNVQFITLFCPVPFNGENDLDNHTIKFRAAGSVDSEVYTIPAPDGFDGATAGKALLFATQDFANLGLLEPDFIIPDDFLGLEGTLNVFENTDTLTWELLPTDGFLSLNGLGAPGGNRPRNYAGDEVEIPRYTNVGGNTADYLTGTDDSEFMVGLGGDDSLNGDLGDDTINGGDGNDTLDGGIHNDSLIGGAGNDAIDGGSYNDRLIGGGGNDTLNGAGQKDNLKGDAGNDTLVYGAGDTLNAGSGKLDTLRIGVALLDLSNNTVNPNKRLLNFEQIDLRDGAHTLKLAKADVLDMSSTSTIKILGDGADIVNIVGKQVAGGAAPAGFTRYTTGSAVLMIDSDISVI
jgi:hypothetical protein